MGASPARAPFGDSERVPSRSPVREAQVHIHAYSFGHIHVLPTDRACVSTVCWSTKVVSSSPHLPFRGPCMAVGIASRYKTGPRLDTYLWCLCWQVCNPSALALNLRRPSSRSMGDRATHRHPLVAVTITRVHICYPISGTHGIAEGAA